VSDPPPAADERERHDGEAVRWTPAPDEYEASRVRLAIANTRPRPPLGAVLVDF
jgi:hypothetical protein